MKLTELTLEKPITKTKLNQFYKKGIENVESLLRFTPIHFRDYSELSTFDDAVSGGKFAFKLKLNSVIRSMGRRAAYIRGTLSDEMGREAYVTWFDPYQYNKLLNYVNTEILIAGDYVINDYGRQILNPDILEPYKEDSLRILPIYSKIQGMSAEYFNNILNTAISQYNKPDPLPQDVLEKFEIISESELIKKLHYPKSLADINDARIRLAFEDIYQLAYKLAEDAVDINKKSPYVISKKDKYNKLIQLLPYELTDDQKKVIDIFIKAAEKGERVNALVQGDVGSGKTIVSILMMTLMVENGYQAALMAPTGILARQHYAEIKDYMDKLDIKVAYLGGDTKTAERKRIMRGLETGKIQILVGTHAVISDGIYFRKLGLTVVDEEHKFGVKQREALTEKAKEGVHNISMSATPIPRSLANTLYSGSCDVFSIETMPNGRKPVRTEQVYSFSPMLKFMEKEIKAGHQCYIVCPLIEETHIDTETKLYSVEEVEKIAKDFFGPKGIVARSVNGKLKDEEKDEIINSFINNECQVLIATTIIEVGVNVPNATVISIINAERYGLAGLHQLRGRVGRSDLQSYCMLLSAERGNPRLEAMCQTNSGFEIAEIDLKLRGTGDITGVRQSGEDKKISLMLRYPGFFTKVKEYLINKLETQQKERKEREDNKMADFNYEIIKELAVLSESPKGWRKEVNLISWNGAEPKYDIRDWAPEHEKMGKGITLTKEEMEKFLEIKI